MSNQKNDSKKEEHRIIRNRNKNIARTCQSSRGAPRFDFGKEEREEKREKEGEEEEGEGRTKETREERGSLLMKVASSARFAAATIVPVTTRSQLPTTQVGCTKARGTRVEHDEEAFQELAT